MFVQRTVLNLKKQEEMEKSVAYSLVKRRDFKDPEGNDRLYYALARPGER